VARVGWATLDWIGLTFVAIAKEAQVIRMRPTADVWITPGRPYSFIVAPQGRLHRDRRRCLREADTTLTRAFGLEHRCEFGSGAAAQQAWRAPSVFHLERLSDGSEVGTLYSI
jgi:hypothetical protein